MQWYVVHTYSGYENRAKKSLEERIKQNSLDGQFGEVLIPTENVMELGKGGQKKTTKRKKATRKKATRKKSTRKKATRKKTARKKSVRKKAPRKKTAKKKTRDTGAKKVMRAATGPGLVTLGISIAIELAPIRSS